MIRLQEGAIHVQEYSFIHRLRRVLGRKLSYKSENARGLRPLHRYISLFRIQQFAATPADHHIANSKKQGAEWPREDRLEDSAVDPLSAVLAVTCGNSKQDSDEQFGKKVNEQGVLAKDQKERGPARFFLEFDKVDQTGQYDQVEADGQQNEWAGPQFFADGKNEVPGTGNGYQGRSPQEHLGKALRGFAVTADGNTGEITGYDIDDGRKGAKDTFWIECHPFPMIHMVISQQQQVKAITGVTGHAIGVGAGDRENQQGGPITQEQNPGYRINGAGRGIIDEQGSNAITETDAFQHAKDAGMGE